MKVVRSTWLFLFYIPKCISQSSFRVKLTKENKILPARRDKQLQEYQRFSTELNCIQRNKMTLN